MDEVSWTSVAVRFLSPLLVFGLGLYVHRVEVRKERARKELAESEREFRAQLSERMSVFETSQKQMLQDQRACQLSLAKNFRLKADADRQWNEQYRLNNSTRERMTRVETLINIKALPLSDGKDI
jgi:uncharacterized protein YaiL (DUF2058 family)